MTKPNRIFVRATNWVGDAVMSLPALQALRAAHPNAHIAILARPWVADLYSREEFCNEWIPYSAPRGWGGVREKAQAIARLKQGDFDCAILLPNSFESAALAFLARVPRRVGYRRDARGPLLTQAIKRPGPGEIPAHQRFYYLELLRRAELIAGYDIAEPIRLSGAQDAARAGATRLAQERIGRAPIGVAPGAAFGGAKRWLPERFADAATAVWERNPEADVVIFGSQLETALCEEVSRHLKAIGVRAFNMAGRTSLRELIECTAACQVFLTNDSGPMHIASALGVPTVAVFGATDASATGPTGPDARVVQHPVACSPCLLRECPIDHRCMTGVQAPLVADEALRLLTVLQQERK